MTSLAQGAALVSSIWREQSAPWFCLVWRLDFNHAPRLEWFRPGDFADIAEVASEHVERGHHLFWTPHGFETRIRQAVHAVAAPWLWSDLDDMHPANCPFRPSIAYSSSPGRYVGLWRIDKPLLGRQVRNDINREIMHGDSGGGMLTRFVRYPGAPNLKYDPPARGRLLWTDGPSHKLADILARLPLSHTRARRRVGKPSSGRLKVPHSVPPPTEEQRRVLRSLTHMMSTAHLVGPDTHKMIFKMVKTAQKRGLDDAEVIWAHIVAHRAWQGGFLKPAWGSDRDARLFEDVERILAKAGTR